MELIPGNVRELQNILERAVTLCENNVIQVQDLQLFGSKEPVTSDTTVSDASTDVEEGKTSSAAALPDDEESLDSYLEKVERNAIIEALENTRWNKTAAAKLLGITFRALCYKLKKFDLE